MQIDLENADIEGLSNTDRIGLAVKLVQAVWREQQAAKARELAREEREKHERSAIKSAFNRVWRAVVAAVKDIEN